MEAAKTGEAENLIQFLSLNVNRVNCCFVAIAFIFTKIPDIRKKFEGQKKPSNTNVIEASILFLAVITQFYM